MASILPSTSSSYTQSLPKDIPLAAARSFLASSFATAIFTGGNFVVGCAVGGVAATATFVEAFARPFINKIFGRQPHDTSANRDTWHLLRTIAVLFLATIAAAPIVGITTSVFFSVCITLGLEAYINPPGQTNSACTFVLV